MSGHAEAFYRGLMRFFPKSEDGGDGLRDDARLFLETLAGEGNREILPPLYRESVDLLHREYEDARSSPRGPAMAAFEAMDGSAPEKECAETLWKVLFPEATNLHPDPDGQIPLLREKRRVRITKTAVEAVDDAAKRIIFTSNVLLSPPTEELRRQAVQGPPGEGAPGEGTGESANPQQSDTARIVEGASRAAEEKQLYWYDHPIPVGVPLQNDEAVYGLKGLAEAFAYEKSRGTVPPNARMTVMLSVSVTHRGLHQWARPWLRRQLDACGPHDLDGLDIYAFTEDDSERIADIIEPWLPGKFDAEELRACFGVDGEYGRHYSFLKALPALTAVLADRDKTATFKIDLDQVFPQEALTAETGKSAFEHFRTGLWGSHGVDAEGREVELGMIAGALVNEKDISAGLFTPDIPWPVGMPDGDDLIFYKQRPMAVSTRAELMTRYGAAGAPDGINEALHRIHVTGGTNGILFESLRRHRPFTPSFVGRAEDQAYLLSVLDGRGGNPALRYLHASGLFMRHDKEAFATEAVKAGKAGSYVGDLVRIFVFSCYAGILGDPGSLKETIDPFTGCFVTPMPATLAMLRLAFRMAEVNGGSEEEKRQIFELADARLKPWIADPEATTTGLKNIFESERRAWDAYFDALEAMDADLARGSSAAHEAAVAFRSVMEDCRIHGN